MINCRVLRSFLRDGIIFLLRVGHSRLQSRQALVLENLVLRSQLALFEQQIIDGKRPMPWPMSFFRFLWVYEAKNIQGQWFTSRYPNARIKKGTLMTTTDQAL